jgi:hypothetical protein
VTSDQQQNIFTQIYTIKNILNDFKFNSQNTQNPSGNPPINPQENRIYQRPYLSIDRCSPQEELTANWLPLGQTEF